MNSFRTARPSSRKRGQALLEYVLLLGLISTMAAAMTRFFLNDFFAEGLRELPSAVSPCLSQGAGKCGP